MNTSVAVISSKGRHKVSVEGTVVATYRRKSDAVAHANGLLYGLIILPSV